MRSVAGEQLNQIYRNFCRLLDNAAVGGSGRGIREPHLLRQLEVEIITLLLLAPPHNYTRLLNRRAAAGAWQLTAAEEFMEANARLSPSLGDICTVVGVNARTPLTLFARSTVAVPCNSCKIGGCRACAEACESPEKVRRSPTKPLAGDSFTSGDSRTNTASSLGSCPARRCGRREKRGNWTESNIEGIRGERSRQHNEPTTTPERLRAVPSAPGCRE